MLIATALGFGQLGHVGGGLLHPPDHLPGHAHVVEVCLSARVLRLACADRVVLVGGEDGAVVGPGQPRSLVSVEGVQIPGEHVARFLHLYVPSPHPVFDVVGAGHAGPAGRLQRQETRLKVSSLVLGTRVFRASFRTIGQSKAVIDAPTLPFRMVAEGCHRVKSLGYNERSPPKRAS